MLHLTNGSAIVPKMQGAGLPGRIVMWDDVLHEGPVPAGLGPAALRERRADFLASCGWGSHAEIYRDLETRDAALDMALGTAKAAPLRATSEAAVAGSGAASAAPAEEIVLWFEHDLYDQLQLLQILDRLPVDGGPRVTAVIAPTYLGHVPESEYSALYQDRRSVSSAERMAARDAWQAFRSADPRAVGDVLPRVTVLPHVGPALRRHLQQFPSVDNGLSRTEQQTLEAVAAGATRLKDVFVNSNHNREEAVFMGDAAFLFHISPLIQSARPLLRAVRGTFSPSDPSLLDQDVELTSDGMLVLTCERDRVEMSGIARWLGGVLVAGNGPVWRWDRERDSLRFV